MLHIAFFARNLSGLQITWRAKIGVRHRRESADDDFICNGVFDSPPCRKQQFYKPGNGQVRNLGQYSTIEYEDFQPRA